MPNIQNCLKLASIIEKQPWTPVDGGVYWGTGFHMSTYKHECGTPCCIAGFAAACAHLEREKKDANPANVEMSIGNSTLIKEASRWLELDENEFNDLFHPGWTYAYAISPQVAAFQLRHLAETGELMEWMDAIEGGIA